MRTRQVLLMHVQAARVSNMRRGNSRYVIKLFVQHEYMKIQTMTLCILRISSAQIAKVTKWRWFAD